MLNSFYAVFLTLGLIVLSGRFPKIALYLAGLIFLGAVLLNVDTFKTLIKGGQLQ